MILLIVLVLAALALLWFVNQAAQWQAGRAGAQIVAQFVSTNMDELPFRNDAKLCIAPDTGAMARFIRDTRADLRDALVPAWYSPLARVNLRLEQIDHVSGDDFGGTREGAGVADPVVTGAGGRSLVPQVRGETRIFKAKREIPLVYSVATTPNWITQVPFALAFVFIGGWLWQHIPGGLSKGQGFWYGALIDAGASKNTARQAVERLGEAEAQDHARRAVFDVLVDTRQYPPVSALQMVFGTDVQTFGEQHWEWAGRLLAADTQPAERIFAAVARLAAAPSGEQAQWYERFVAALPQESALAVFEQMFDPGVSGFTEAQRHWAERLATGAPDQLASVFAAVAGTVVAFQPDVLAVYERLVGASLCTPALQAYALLSDSRVREFDREAWQWLDFALQDRLDAAEAGATDAQTAGSGETGPKAAEVEAAEVESAEPGAAKAGETDDLESLWNYAVGIAHSDLKVELRMNELKTGKSLLFVKGIHLRKFRQAGTLIYYGQYLYRRCIGDGWLENPGSSTGQAELKELAVEFNRLLQVWGSPESMTPVPINRENARQTEINALKKQLSDRLNNGRNQIRNAFSETFAPYDLLQERFSFEEERRERRTAYRVRFSPEQIVLHPFPERKAGSSEKES